MAFYCYLYCAFQKHANSKINGSPSQLRFSLPSIIITITSNEPWDTETHKTDRHPPITNHKQWPFEPVKVKFRFLRGPLRWLTAVTNAIVSWLLNFTIRMFVKSAVIMMQRHRQSEFDASRIRLRLGGLPHLETFTWQNLTPAERATRFGGSPHLSCKRDQIKMREYIDWRVTSPTWGPSPPCKQALN